ncbi:hypothetical protein [Bifidobacterium choerinum]|uniref:Uncharacterized protein n=1 Tax=Bifidobacterium choerinum TaxID=35760 RepID=A0A087AC94_9BIFI|nr:hypothetical protein [Bifidobacterium choerinum]KFI56394.1 hypothetical protein BCHO_1506 [Bifidobacterium choerinum]
MRGRQGGDSIECETNRSGAEPQTCYDDRGRITAIAVIRPPS